MNNEKVQILENHLLESDELTEASHYFFTHFGEKEAFLSESKKVNIRFFQSLILHTLKAQLQKDKITLLNPSFFLHEETGLLHGAAIVEDLFTVFFFSKRVSKGILSLNNLVDSSCTIVHLSPRALNGMEDHFQKLLEQDELDFNLN